MKGRDLIEKLKTFDPEALVVTSGMDQMDYEELRKIELIEIVRKPEGSTSFGDYGKSDPEDPEQRIKAVVVDYF